MTYISNKKGKTYIQIYGIDRAKDEKHKRSIAHLGRIFSNEHKAKLSIRKKNKTYEEIYGVECAQKLKAIRTKARLGFKLSNDTKHKISMSYKLKRQHWTTPKFDTSIEVKIQNFLKVLGIEYFTHQHMYIKHRYQCDIYIPIMNLVIECDGNYWHSYPTGQPIDHIRTTELLAKGFKVLRLWESDINEMDINSFNTLLMNKCSGG